MSANAGIHLPIGSFSSNAPSSHSVIAHTEAIGLVIEAIRKIVSASIASAGFPVPMAVAGVVDDLVASADRELPAGKLAGVDVLGEVPVDLGQPARVKSEVGCRSKRRVQGRGCGDGH